MAFKRSRTSTTVFDTPYSLFQSLSGRKFPDLMIHQEQILKSYQEQGLNKANVALQLPTGSGKTLVGVLIAEWRRRKFKEKIVYLCPTKQLVQQTCLQAERDHKIKMVALTGSKNNFSPEDAGLYQTGRAVAVTTISGIFNAKSFFDDADVLIMDDAHSAENYIPNLWSVEIDPRKEQHRELFEALLLCLEPEISILDYARLAGRWTNNTDANWFDKLPTPKLHKINENIQKTIATYIYKTDQKFSWMQIAEHLEACQMYFSSNGILIRPLIAPTWTLDAFSNPKQRIFMSATLGSGGDLERLTGLKNIFRLPVPEGFGKNGIGRRFFIFPEMKMSADEADKLRLRLLQKAGRGVIITPNDKERNRIAAGVEPIYGAENVFDARDIEASNDIFVGKKNAAVILANRYDGIDFPNDDCRFLCVDGLQRATNAQENFFLTRMGARVLYNERIQTRVLQAVGRCTRALQDYSAVYITGSELQAQLADPKLMKHFPPEYQAEINFGIETSLEANEEGLIENFELFLEHSQDWLDVNADIVDDIASYQKEPFPELDKLESVVSFEIEYQQAMWRADYVSAIGAAKKVITGLEGGKDLQGYRGMWHYLAGSAAFLAAEYGQASTIDVAREQYDCAKKCAKLISWLADLSKVSALNTDEQSEVDNDTLFQLERIERKLSEFGNKNDAKFERFEKEILEGLSNPDKFEASQVKLGELIGFDSNKIESSGSPDPYWIAEKRSFVFEDHAEANPGSMLAVKKARQAAAHKEWLNENVSGANQTQIITFLVTPVTTADQGGLPALKSVAIWPLEEYIEWTKNCLSVIREIKASFSEIGNMEWRENTLSLLEKGGMTSESLENKANANNAYDYFKE